MKTGFPINPVRTTITFNTVLNRPTLTGGVGHLHMMLKV